MAKAGRPKADVIKEKVVSVRMKSFQLSWIKKVLMDFLLSNERRNTKPMR